MKLKYVAEGFVDRAVKTLNEAEKDFDNLFNTSYKAAGVEYLQEKRKQQEKEKVVEDTLTDLAKKIDPEGDGLDEVQYLIETYGYKDTVDMVNTMHENSKKTGNAIDLKAKIGLEKRMGPGVTAQQLVSQIVPPMKVTQKSLLKENLSIMPQKKRGIITDLFAPSIEDAIADIGEDTVTEVEKPTIPKALSGRGLYKWEVYGVQDDPFEEGKRLTKIADNLQNRAVERKDVRLAKEAEAARIAAKDQFIINESYNNIDKPLTTEQTKNYNNHFKAKIAEASGELKQGEFRIGDDGTFYITSKDESVFSGELNEAASRVTAVFNKAIKAGVDPADAMENITKAIRQNKVPVFIPASQEFARGGNFSYLDDPLVSFGFGQDLEEEKKTKTQNTGGGSDAVTSYNNLVDDYRTETDTTKKEIIKNRALRMAEAVGKTPDQINADFP